MRSWIEVIKLNFSFTIVCILFICLFLGLGSWQVRRLAWKQEVIAIFKQREKMHAKSLPSVSSATSWLQNNEFKQIVLQGNFIVAGTVFVYGTKQDIHGKVLVGAWVMKLFKPHNQQPVLLNLGFKEQPFDAEYIDSNIDNYRNIEINGRIRKSVSSGIFTPSADKTKSMWYVKDVSSITEFLNPGIPTLRMFYLDNIVTKTIALGSFIKSGDIVFRNRHFEYAVTWFVLAAVLLIGWFLRMASIRGSLNKEI